MNVKEYKETAAILRAGGRVPLEVFKEYKRKSWASGKRWHIINRRNAIGSAMAFNAGTQARPVLEQQKQSEATPGVA